MTEMIVSAKATLALAPTLNITHACGFQLAAARDDAFFISVFGDLFNNAAGKMLGLPVSLRTAASRAVACGDCVRVRTATAAVRFVVVQIHNSTESNKARVISVPAAVFPSLIASNDNSADVTYELADCSFERDATIRLQSNAVVVENSNIRIENVAVEFENASRIVAQQNPLWMTRFELPGGWQELPGASRLVVTGATNTSRTLYLSPVGSNGTLTELALPQLGVVDRGFVWIRVPRTVANTTTDPVAIVGIIFLIATFLAAIVWLVDIWRRRRAGKTDDALQ